jgi:hypothetical protein
MLTCVPPNQLIYRLLDGWNYRVKFVLDSTEPVNFTACHISTSKEVKFREIEKWQYAKALKSNLES